MPDYNLRNSPQSSQLQAEFARKSDHMLGAAMLPGLLLNMMGRRVSFLYSRHDRSSANLPVYYPIPLITNGHFFTSTAGAPSAVSPNNVHMAYGWNSQVRLGSTVGYGLYTTDHALYRVAMSEANILAADRGMTLFMAFSLPAAWTAPGSGTELTLYSRWQASGNQRAYIWGYGFNAAWQATHGFQFYNSGAGTAATIRGIGPVGADLQLQTGIADWQLILAGVSVEPNGGAYFYLNDKWEYVAAPQYDPAVLGDMGTNFAGTAQFCTARRDDAGTPAPWDDLYATFGGLLDMLMLPGQWRAFYEFVKPTLLANTDLGGT